MTTVTPGDVARKRQQREARRQFGAAAPAVNEVDNVFGHFLRKVDAPQTAALLTLAVALRIDPEEEP